MLFVSLSGENHMHAFWSHLHVGRSGRNATMFSRQGHFKVALEEIMQNAVIVRFKAESFSSQLLLEPQPDWSRLGFNSNFPTRIPDLSHVGLPPRGTNINLVLYFPLQLPSWHK